MIKWQYFKVRENIFSINFLRVFCSFFAETFWGFLLQNFKAIIIDINPINIQFSIKSYNFHQLANDILCETIQITKLKSRVIERTCYFDQSIIIDYNS